MSEAEKSRLYDESLIIARGGLATLRRRTGNRRLDRCEDRRIVADAALIAGESLCPPGTSFKMFFRKCIFKAIDRLHTETRTDRGHREIQASDDQTISRIAADHLAPSLDDPIANEQMHRKYRKLLATVMATSKTRGPGCEYMNRLPMYSENKYTTKEIADDLGRSPEDVHQYRLRAIRIWKVEDK